VRHPWLGGPRRLTMYLATLDCATSNPSLSKLAVDARRSPKRVLNAHSPDQHAEVRLDLRPPCAFRKPHPPRHWTSPAKEALVVGTNETD
jgi:hypothetical protein